jgi:membrane-associated phospholipid phosphatase
MSPARAGAFHNARARRCHLTGAYPRVVTLDDHPDLVRLTAARRSAAADAVGHLSDPAVLVPLVLLVVAARATDSLAQALGWATLAAVFCIGVPYALLHVLVRRGAVTDRHVVVRDQRRAPLVAGVVSVVAGVVVLNRLGAPAPITALVVAMLAGLAAMAVVSLVYKASLHVAVVTGVATILAVTVGIEWGLLLLPLVALVAWARVRAGRHTAGQALVGFVVGCAAAGVVYPILAG